MSGCFSLIDFAARRPFVRLRRRHPDVDDRDVRLVHRDVAEEVLGRARLRDDLEARLVEQPRDPLPEQHRVVGEHDAHGRRAGPGAERRKVAAEARIVELEDPLRIGQVRERPEPEIAQLVLGRERGRRGLREDDLASMPRRGDALGAVDVDADVTVLAERGSARVEADANAHRRRPRMPAEPPLSLDGRSDGRLRRGEGGEELVAARVHHVPVGAGYRIAQQPANVREYGLPLLSQLPGEAGGALDVGEEERDGAGGKGAHMESLGLLRHAASSSSSGLRLAA